MHTMPDQQSASPNAEGEQPDTLVTDKAICEEFAITPMSLWRWDRDERLGFRLLFGSTAASTEAAGRLRSSRRG
jgi:hypothetical protein